MSTCKCVSVKGALHHALQNEDIPVCPEHDAPPRRGDAIALNNNSALAARLGMPLSNGSDL